MSELPPTTLAPALLLQLVADELRHGRDMLERIENATHQALDSDDRAAMDRHWRGNLQHIDLLEQHLADIASCLSRLAAQPALQEAAGISGARVLGPLKLDDLRRRLLGRPDQETEWRKIELF